MNENQRKRVKVVRMRMITMPTSTTKEGGDKTVFTLAVMELLKAEFKTR